MIVLGVVVAVLLVGVLVLIPLGLREGEKPGDAVIVAIAPGRGRPGWSCAPATRSRVVKVTVRNPGALPLLVGMTLRRPRFRLHLETGTYVRLRTRRATADLLPSRQATVGVVRPNEDASFEVAANRRLGRRAELVVVMGQPGRLRTVHRAVELPAFESTAPAQGRPAPRLTV